MEVQASPLIEQRTKFGHSVPRAFDVTYFVELGRRRQHEAGDQAGLHPRSVLVPAEPLEVEEFDCLEQIGLFCGIGQGFVPQPAFDEFVALDDSFVDDGQHLGRPFGDDGADLRRGGDRVAVEKVFISRRVLIDELLDPLERQRLLRSCAHKSALMRGSMSPQCRCIEPRFLVSPDRSLCRVRKTMPHAADRVMKGSHVIGTVAFPTCPVVSRSGCRIPGPWNRLRSPPGIGSSR